jgi:hypothetical protein
MFSAFDLQCNEYFHSGRNSKTKKQCMEDVVDMLVNGQDEFTWADFEKSAKKDNQTVDEYIIDLFDVRIDQHEERIEDDIFA